MVVKPAQPEPPRAKTSRPPREMIRSAPQTVATVNRRPVTRRRNVTIGLAIGIGLVAMLMGLIAILFWPAKSRIPSDDEVWTHAKAELADRLKSPRSAEFPKPGRIRRIAGTGHPTWSVDSVVDAKNALGVPLRNTWEMQLSFDPDTRTWETASVDLDGKRVFTSVALTRANEKFFDEAVKIEKEQADRRLADKEREREYARAQAAIREKLAADEREQRQKRIAEAQEKAAQARIERQERDRLDRENAEKRREAVKEARLQEIETRRADGRWNIVAKYTGAEYNPARKRSFRPRLAGWRIRYEFSNPAVIRVLDRDGTQIGSELTLKRGSGSEIVSDVAPGTFLIDVKTRGKWSLTIEE